MTESVKDYDVSPRHVANVCSGVKADGKRCRAFRPSYKTTHLETLSSEPWYCHNHKGQA